MRKKTVYRRATTASKSQPFSALVLHVLAWQCNRCGKLHAWKDRALTCCSPCTFTLPFTGRRLRPRGLPCSSAHVLSHTDDPYCDRCGFSKRMADAWRRKYGRAFARRKAMETTP